MQPRKLCVFLTVLLSAAALGTTFAKAADRDKPGHKHAEDTHHGKVEIKPHSALLMIDVQNCFTSGGTLPVDGGAEVSYISYLFSCNSSFQLSN